MNKIVVNSVGREKRMAIVKNHQLEKLMIEQPKQESLVGGIYAGIVEKVVPGMNAAFINIGFEKNGYLHRDKLPGFLKTKEDKNISAYLRQGERILVQVEKDATGQKGPRLSGIIELNGSMLVYMPEGTYIAVSKKMQEREKWRRFGFKEKLGDEGILFRTAIEGHTEEEAAMELAHLRETFSELREKSKKLKKPGLVYKRDSFLEAIVQEAKRLGEGSTVMVDDLELKKKLEALPLDIQFYNGKEGIFSVHQMEGEVEKALERTVWLENGAYLIFDEAEALTVIDVNTGKFLGREEQQDTVVKTNEQAAEEIARQIRLRDLAGIILIDFIDMESPSARERVKEKLEEALHSDDRRTRIVGFTPLGILQLTRQKKRVSIRESLMSPCPTCAGEGRVPSCETVAFRLERELYELRGGSHEAVLIETTEEVKQVFAGEHQLHQKRMEEVIGLKIFYQLEEAAKPYYALRQFGTVEEIRRKAR